MRRPSAPKKCSVSIGADALTNSGIGSSAEQYVLAEGAALRGLDVEMVPRAAARHVRELSSAWWTRRNWLERACGGVVLALIIVAACAGVIAPFDPAAQIAPRLQPPTAAHPFGTDHLGRDPSLASRELESWR